jgi:3-hydroxyisobutyrate dehydrogenase-like beta-hydroxyacid dehydrogenase
MAQVTRQGFIKQASVGAAAVGAATALPSLVSAHAAQAAASSDLAKAELHGPVAAYVRDARTGEIAVLVGTREIVVHDPKLVMRLLRIAHSK